MGKILRCEDMGFECPAVIRADSEEKILKLVARHAKEMHGVEKITKEMTASARSAIKDE